MRVATRSTGTADPTGRFKIHMAPGGSTANLFVVGCTSLPASPRRAAVKVKVKTSLRMYVCYMYYM